MDIETGNAGDVETKGTGWFIGFGPWTSGLRHLPAEQNVRGLCVKWAAHPAGDPRGTAKPVSTGRTVSLLVGQGPFRVEFCESADFADEQTMVIRLERVGDYVIWGAGVHHRWFADGDSTILTVRWEE
ncbi:MAG TPA: hypothetical protein VGB55_12200 [Tepidisphaeraceae bacterium]|jgi:hypothetical protein